MFSIQFNIKFGVHDADKREFKDLLTLLKSYIPVDNSLDDIFNKQTVFYKNDKDMEKHLSNNNSIIFLPQNSVFRNEIINDINKYSLLDLSNSKSFYNQLELKSVLLSKKKMIKCNSNQ